jgi:ABC-type sugar transport system substrate-binding protein
MEEEMKKKLFVALAVIVCVIMSFGLAACGGGSGNTSDGDADTSDSDVVAAEENDVNEEIAIGVHVKTMGNPLFREVAWGAVERGELLGAEVVVGATTKDGQLDEQIQQIEDMIVKGVDALVVTPQDTKGIVPAVQAAQAAGIPFIAVDTNVDGIEPDCFIGMDNISGGYDVGKIVCEKIGGEGTLVIIPGVAGAGTSIDRTEGYKKAAAEYPGINVVVSPNADFDQAKGQQVMADLLQSTKNVKAVLSCGDLMALGAIVSLEEAGYTVGGDDGVIIGSYDICTPILEAVKSGKVYVEGYHWGQLYGQWGVEMAIRAIKGEPTPKVITSPHSEITADNVDVFIEFAKAQENYEFKGL